MLVIPCLHPQKLPKSRTPFCIPKSNHCHFAVPIPKKEYTSEAQNNINRTGDELYICVSIVPPTVCGSKHPWKYLHVYSSIYYWTNVGIHFHNGFSRYSKNHQTSLWTWIDDEAPETGRKSWPEVWWCEQWHILNRDLKYLPSGNLT